MISKNKCYKKGIQIFKAGICFSIVTTLAACGQAGVSPPPPLPEVRHIPLNDTGITYFIDEKNFFFYEDKSSREPSYTIDPSIDVNSDGSPIKKSGSPLLYNVINQNNFPLIPVEAFVPQFVEPDQFPGQDGSFGRDVSLQGDDSNGIAGFDFTKLDAAGNALPDNAVDFSCVRDNVTGLTWEHKTDKPASEDWHSATAIFTWYDTNSATNGGDPGQRAIDSICPEGRIKGDTHTLVQVTNNENLCGIANWRLPTAEEARSLVNYQVKRGTVKYINSKGKEATATAMADVNFFPNLAATEHRWTSQTVNVPNFRHQAWGFHFHEGQIQAHDKACVATDTQVKGFTNGALLVSGPNL